MDRSNNMAATNFMAPLFVLFLFTISIKKWNECTGNVYERVQGIPEFKFSTLLSQEEGIPLGYQKLNKRAKCVLVILFYFGYFSLAEIWS